MCWKRKPTQRWNNSEDRIPNAKCGKIITALFDKTQSLLAFGRGSFTQKRIWELDALRGVCILAMVGIHLGYDLNSLYARQPGVLFSLVQKWGGGIFFLLSGICATLGHRPLRRGLTVLGCGLLCTAATAAVYALGLADKGILIWFGTLHCLGVCMLLWPLFRSVPTALLLAGGAVLTAAGIKLLLQPLVGPGWLLPVGILPPDFATADYFPLLPFLGIFLLGACLGRRLYPGGMPRLRIPMPRPLGVLCACGRWALPIYLLHQPVLAGFLYLIVWLRPV